MLALKLTERFVDPEPKPVVKIVYWYDRASKNWVTQAADEDGNQVGDAAYSGQRKGRIFDCQALAKQHGVTRIEKKV
jgi:hypothetical protein